MYYKNSKHKKVFNHQLILQQDNQKVMILYVQIIQIDKSILKHIKF